MVEIFKNLVVEEEGQGMTEYGLILGLIAVAAIAVFGIFGEQMEGVFENIIDTVTGASEDTSGT